MGDKESSEPSLELPSFGLGRKRRRDRTPDAPADGTGDRPTGPTGPTTPEAADEPTRTLPAEPVVEQPPAAPAPPLFADEVEPEQPTSPLATAVAPPAAPTEPEPRAGRRGLRLPALGGYTASVISGVLVGVLTVGLTWAGFRLCEVVQGTSSCGKPGILLLLAILLTMVLLGKALLRAWSVPEPGSTSFLAVGLLAVMILLFLVGTIFSWWMIIAVPAIAAGTFALAHWVTTYVELD
ncbi:hypothetical protein ACFP3Q_06510 [Nocardioides sp. GCM10027113]|uniref:hypothetical protein n=1 Tax=unclassified Nocardioides TaxID=2615069 RepID=UPI00361B53F4